MGDISTSFVESKHKDIIIFFVLQFSSALLHCKPCNMLGKVKIISES